MRKDQKIAVIIPALNEESAIGKVLVAIPNWVDQIIVVDNGSTDSTATIATSHGAAVVYEPKKGYGTACIAGLNALENTHIVVFLDGDFSDDPRQMDLIVDPIVNGRADLVLGQRRLTHSGKQGIAVHAQIGNRFATFLIRHLFGVPFSDLGPFRAVRFSSLQKLHLRDRNFGWNVEMQIKALKNNLKIEEVDVPYRKRIGKSKISGTLLGTLGAGTKILWTIFSLAYKR